MNTYSLKFQRWFSAFTFPVLLAGTVAAQPVQPPTLDQIMADPDWIGPAVGAAWWSWDGRRAYYSQKRAGAEVYDLVALSLSDGDQPGRAHILSGAERAGMDAPNPVFNAARTQMAFIRNGDVFVRDLRQGRLAQLTRTLAGADQLQWSDADALTWRGGNGWFGWTAEYGVGQIAALLAEDAPETAPEPDALRDTQLRLFATLRSGRERRAAQREQETLWQREDPTRASPPVYLGKNVNVFASALSPDGRWLLVVTEPRSAETGRVGQMPRYINESGYEDTEAVRTRVGRNAPPGQTFWLADVGDGTLREITLDGLAGIADDPLAQLRRAAGQPPLEGLRPLRVEQRGAAGIAWNAASSAVALMLHSVDNKDRWLVSIDPASARASLQHRLTDPGWINWDYNEFGWLPGEGGLWLLSEHTGYSHLYVTTGNGRVDALTQGRWEASAPVYANGTFYFLCNRASPGAYEVCRASRSGGDVREVTAAGGGIEDFVLSPDATRLLVRYSGSYLPPQLALVNVDGEGALQPLTDTRSAAYQGYDWLQPDYVQVPSRHGAGTIHGKLYRPQQLQPGQHYPIVLFVHGAGYLQNVTRRYPNYFREQMFHNLLVQRGYLVLDLDYRASKGYGRDWRTVIYRQMGHPELEDYLDGIDWLVEHHQGDRARVGMYGGSYGGFLTFMALFRAPGTFKAGAALRPVADWRHYNHGYTSNILNTPDVDPQAYLQSSPIEYAAGLQDHLLIAHGAWPTSAHLQRRPIGLAIAPDALPAGLSGFHAIDLVKSALNTDASDAALDYARAVDLFPQLAHSIARYSLGTRQKLAIALALVGDSPLLLLDESLNGLDLASVGRALDYLQTRIRASGQSAILVTHNIDLAQGYAQRVWLLEHGRLMHEWDRDELAKMQRERELISYQIMQRLKKT